MQCQIKTVKPRTNLKNTKQTYKQKQKAPFARILELYMFFSAFPKSVIPTQWHMETLSISSDVRSSLIHTDVWL